MTQHIPIHLLLLSQIVMANLPTFGKGVDLIVQRIYSNKVGKTGREETENEDFSLREKGDGMLIQKANGPPLPILGAFWIGTHATTPNSCYLTAALRCQGQFFPLVDLILGGICHLP